jgi:signal transduction histidine kinase
MAARLALPIVALVALCGLAIEIAFAGPLGPLRFLGSGSEQRRALTEAGTLAGAALVVAVLAVVLVGAYARRLSHEISDLTQDARNLANELLPRMVRELRENPAASGKHGTQVARRTLDAEWLAARVQRTRTAEIATAVTAITSIERTAVEAATGEAALRDGLRQILMSLGRRNQSLLHRQLKIIDQLEQQAVSPGELAHLFALDHLTTRMRRHAESLTILSGAAPVRSWSAPVPVIDVIRAAVAEIEDYKRVSVVTDAEESVAAPAVTDMIHLLAELIENATLFSPSATRVEVRAERVANGFAVEVEDRGLGIAAEQLREINDRLASPPDFDLADADRLGLFVAGRLAARLGVQVELIPSAYRGTRAVVILPESLIATGTESGADSVLRGAARLNVRSPEALNLVGAPASRLVPTMTPTSATASVPLFAPDYPTLDEGDARWEEPVDREALPRRGAQRRRDGQPGHEPVPGSEELPAREPLPRRKRPSALVPEQDTVRRLPRRVRPGSPEQLANGTPVRMPGAARPAEAPAPERARNLAASLQSSWQRSRDADDDIPSTDLGAPGRTPDSEEM